VRAYVLSCEERADVCAETVADLGRTDWGSPATVVLDESTAARRIQRIVDTGLQLLTRAVDEADGADGADDVILVCEDDVTFNRSLRHNLERWSPVVGRRPDGHLFGSLYNPNVVAPSPDGSTSAVVADPRRFYGSQGVVVSVTTARSMVEQWDDGHGPFDLRISRLAARWSPVWYHVPSLVQHRAVESTWGGAPHSADDFSADWRAR
jgi:hypothetical protein